ncbi:MAG: hypothetical protein IIA01_03000 [Proteobacteria bacterium]|nr:hypothetical protein [Pseudomonadota bacterium]
MQEIKIVDIANGGAANGGQDIFFDVKTDDVQEYRVLCPYGEVGALIAKCNCSPNWLNTIGQGGQPDRDSKNHLKQCRSLTIRVSKYVL